MSPVHNEHRVITRDSVEIFYDEWRTTGHQESPAQLLIIPGYGEHSGRYREIGHTLSQQGITVCAMNLRGHGKSEGQRGYVDSFSQYIEDVNAVMGAIKSEAPLFILGHSNGGLVALNFVSEKNPSIAGLIVTNPFLALALKVHPLKLKIAQIAGKVAPRVALPNGISPEGLTHDQNIVSRYKRDPLVFRTATAAWLREASLAQSKVLTLRDMPCPLFFCYSDRDPIADPSTNSRVANQILSDDKTICERRGELHEVLNELKRAQLYETIFEWILKRVE